MTVVISDPDKEWSQNLRSFLQEKSVNSELSANGKDCQLIVYKKKCSGLVLDFDTENHSGLTVLKFMKQNYPSLKVILTFKSQERFQELNLSPDELKKMGATDIMIRPFDMTEVLKNLLGDAFTKTWLNSKDSKTKVGCTEEASCSDSEFTSIKVELFFSGSITIFDHYIKLGPDKYLKILHKNAAYDDEVVKKYKDENKIDSLYFKNEDRMTYISFINDFLEKSIGSDRMPSLTRVMTLRSVCDKFHEELQRNGLSPKLVEEGKRIAKNIRELMQKDRDISQAIKFYNDFKDIEASHVFLVSFFAGLISVNLDWASDRTIELICLAALFHDIGVQQLPEEIRKMPLSEMSAEQVKLFQKHPLLGAEHIQKCENVPKPVVQIIYQHHELINGLGYPNGLAGVKIYPLAKIVALADEFTDLVIEKKSSPFAALKEFIPDRERITRHDSMALKALVTGFLKEKA